MTSYQTYLQHTQSFGKSQLEDSRYRSTLDVGLVGESAEEERNEEKAIIRKEVTSMINVGKKAPNLRHRDT